MGTLNMPGKKNKRDKEHSVSINLKQDHSIPEEKKEEEKFVEFKPQIEKLTAIDPNQPVNKFV